MDYVKKGLGMLLEEEVPLIKLIDRSFNCNPGRAEEILRFVLEHTRCSCVHMELEPRLLTEKLIRLLAEAPAGTFQVEIGIQTANPDTLAAVRRTPLSPEAETRVKQLTELPGVHVHLDLIAGLPMEGYRSFAHSFDYVYNMKPDMLQLGFLKVLHGTAMEEQEEITASSFPPYEVVGTRWITPQELCRLKRVEEAVEQFYNSGGFRETLAVLQPSAPFQLFEELGDLLYHAQQEGRLKRRELYGLLFEYLGEDFRKPLSLDFLKHNQSIPLPEFTRPQRERGFKDQMYRLMKQPKFCKKYGVEPDLRRLRFERMDGTAYMVDYATGRLFVLEEVPVLYEKWMQL